MSYYIKSEHVLSSIFANKRTMLTRFFAFLTLSTLPLLLNAQNTFYQPDEFACAGKKVEMKCYVQAPSDETFSISVPLISFDLSDPYTMDQINNNNVPNVDTSRYHVEQITTGNTRIGAKITINSFVATDSDILFGCHGRYYNDSDTDALASGYPPETPVPPTKIYTVHAEVLSVSYFCSAKLKIYFLPSGSDVPIQYYEMYINGKLSDDHLDNKTSYFNSAYVSLSVAPATTYKISVAAVSCAGTAATSDIDDSSTFSIPSFELDSFYFSLDYFNGLYIDWSFQEKSDIVIAIGYDLKVDTYFQLNSESTIQNQTLTISQGSDLTSYTHDLGLSVITENKVDMAITVKLGISSQCYDSDFAGAVITASDDVVSRVQLINIPTSKVWIVVAGLSVGLLLCSVCNVIAILVGINENSRRRSAFRKQTYTQFSGLNEHSEPLLREEQTIPVPRAGGNYVNTIGQVPTAGYEEMSGMKL